MNGFGIYILTYPGDFHLSTVLVHSLREVNPGIPIMIIPGEGFDEGDHPFDVPIMPRPDGFWRQIGHQDRDFWCFQGPFETFLYLDADTLCTGRLDALAARIDALRGNFMLVQPWRSDADWRQAVGDPAHPRHGLALKRVASQLGRGALSAFDPEYDFYAHFPFNSGVFASRRGAITERDLDDLNRRERAFYRDTLGIPQWTWRSSELFFRDQGRLNYLSGKLGIAVLPLAPEVQVRSGASAVRVTLEGVRDGCYDFHVIHWMGAKAPSPSLFSRNPLFSLYAFLWCAVARDSGRWFERGYERLPECVGYSLWRTLNDRANRPISWTARLIWTWRDVQRTAKLFTRYLRRFHPSALAGRKQRPDTAGHASAPS
jgi:hypothetical protein